MMGLSKTASLRGDVIGEGWQSLAIGVLIFGFIYPGILFLSEYPMTGTGYLFKDPAAAALNFIPGIRLIKYELFNNFNFLWSNLRGFGVPLLGHEIQAAPLFPLTLAFAWIPEPWFWNITIASRLILSFSGAYLIGRFVFGFSRPATTLFAFSLVFNLFVLRWINHPWQNGLLSGIWYFLFLSLAALYYRSDNKTQGMSLGLISGLSVSVFCMVTNGFPEASVMSALLVVLVYPFVLIQCHHEKRLTLFPLFKCLVVAHLIGFALSSPQLFSLLDLMSQRPEGDGLRSSFGQRQFKLDQLGPFMVTNFAYFGGEIDEFKKTAIGSLVFLLTTIGLLSRFRKTFHFKIIEVGIWLAALFYLLKNFPLWPALNQFIGHLPILEEMYYYVYFFTLFQLFFSYYAAVGLDYIKQESSHFAFTVILTTALLFTAYCLFIYLSDEYSQITVELLGKKIKHLSPILVVSVCLIPLILFGAKKQWIRGSVAMIILFGVIVELKVGLPGKFTPINDNTISKMEIVSESKYMESLLKHDGKSPLDLRTSDPLGRFFHTGIATADHGAPAIVPERNLRLRRALYKSDAAGYMGLGPAIRSFSDGVTAISANTSDIYQGQKVPLDQPDWHALRETKNQKIKIEKIAHQLIAPNQTRIKLSEHTRIIEFKGWGIMENLESTDVEYYLFLSGNKDKHVLKMNTHSRPDVAALFGDQRYMYSGWKHKVHRRAFKSKQYQVTLRLVDRKSSQYSESKLATVQVVPSLNTTPWKQVGQFDGKYYEIREENQTRAYMASGCEAFVDHDEVAKKLKRSVDHPAGLTYIETTDTTERALCDSITGQSTAVPILQDQGSKVSLQTVMGPGLLVLSDTFFPGWQAIDQINSNELSILPANVAFRGILLPENREYKIQFQYRPQWLYLSMVLVALGIIGWIRIGLISKRKRVN